MYRYKIPLKNRRDILRVLLLHPVIIFVLLAFNYPGKMEAFSGNRTAGNHPQLRDVNGTPRSTLLNINKISLWASDNGMTEHHPGGIGAGVTFPRGTGTVVRAAGLVWTGLVDDSSRPMLRLGGQTYTAGTIPGRILSPGIPENPQNASVRIYRIRRDWATADLTDDAVEYYGIPRIDITEEQIAALRAQYQRDWIEWPWQSGAPYYERNGVAGYQPDTTGNLAAADEPGLAGADEVVWFVANDLNQQATTALYGSPPIGLELQVTYWAYRRYSNLQNVVFQRFRLIYKGMKTTPPTAHIESMYVAKWADPDIGDFSDDLVGYAPAQQLGYAYNSALHDAEYDKFRLTPPVVGYTLLQGPAVSQPGATAHWDLASHAGFANLPATGFAYFDPLLRTTDYGLGGYAATQEWWRIFHGDAQSPAGGWSCRLDPTSGQCAPFDFTGDPAMFSGWIDGVSLPAGDRRLMLASGPFSMALGDTQEIAYAFVAGTGQDNRSGISVVKGTAEAARDAYFLNFDFPPPPPAPHVRVVELDQKLLLDWESDTTRIRETESYAANGFKFNTYAIYQLPAADATADAGILYQAFDPTQPRFLEITLDKLRNRPLANGQHYYFAVTSVAFNSAPVLTEHFNESERVVLDCTPHSPNPGVVYPYAIGDSLSIAWNRIGANDAPVYSYYYDPSKPDGHYYKILFNRDSDPLKDFLERPRWSLIDTTTKDTLLRDVFCNSPPQHVIPRGFAMQVMLPLYGLRGVYDFREDRKQKLMPVFNTPDPSDHYMVVAAGSSQLDTIRGENAADRDVEIRFDGDSSWAFSAGLKPGSSRWIRVPFTLWGVGIFGHDTITRRLVPIISGMGSDSVWRPKPLLQTMYQGRRVNVFYPITIVDDSLQIGANRYVGTAYREDIRSLADSATLRGFLFQCQLSLAPPALVIHAYIADLDGDGMGAPKGTAIRFVRYKWIRKGDEKIFHPATVVADNPEAAKQEIARVNVFPNPYYGLNRAETSRANRFVTFSHLPRLATIRIYNLAGVLAKTVRKDDQSQFVTWDLTNESGLTVAAGLYLAYIEMAGEDGLPLGTKTLKLMIVPEDPAPQTR